MSIDAIAGMPHPADLGWEALYDRHSRMMYRVTWRILRNAPDAEDAVQDAFLQVWRDAAKFDPRRGNVEAWLTTVARSRALDRLRMRGARSKREKRCEFLERVSVSSAAAVDDTLIRDERDRSMRKALTNLPAAQRVAAELSFVEGLSHSQIADALYQPLGTIKSRIRLALLKIRAGFYDSREGAVLEPSPFSVSLSEYLAKRPVLSHTYRSLRERHVLVVDDDSETLDLVRTILECAGACVTTGGSASEGATHLRAVWPDVLIADISMPGGDGYSLLRQAQGLASTTGQRLSAIAFTALGRRDHAALLGAGFAAHLAKPVQPHALLSAVADLAGDPTSSPSSRPCSAWLAPAR